MSKLKTLNDTEVSKDQITERFNLSKKRVKQENKKKETPSVRRNKNNMGSQADGSKEDED
jgi:hypothetical protein